MKKPAVVNQAFIAAIAFFFAWAVVGTFVGTDDLYWIIGIVVLLVLGTAVMYLARLSAEQANQLVERVNANPLIKGVVIFIVRALAFSACLYVIFGVIPEWIQGTIGVEWRWAVALTTVLGLPLIGIMRRLFGPTGIPGDPAVIRKAFRGVAFLTLIFFAWWYYDQPSRFFDVKTGEATFWVAEKEGKIYYFPTSSEGDTAYHSPSTGERLRRGTPVDAEKYRRESWVKEAKALVPSIGVEGITAPPRIERITWQPERFVLGKPGEWLPTVPNVDTVTWGNISYKMWANKPYKVATSDPKTGKRVVTDMPATPMYWYCSHADIGVGSLPMTAIEGGTVVMVQRVQ